MSLYQIIGVLLLDVAITFFTYVVIGTYVMRLGVKENDPDARDVGHSVALFVILVMNALAWGLFFVLA